MKKWGLSFLYVLLVSVLVLSCEEKNIDLANQKTGEGKKVDEVNTQNTNEKDSNTPINPNDNGNTVENGQQVPEETPFPKRIVKIVTSNDSFAILHADKTVSFKERIDLTNVVSISSSTDVFAAIKEDGSVVTWGNKYSGGDFTYSDGSTAAAPEGSLSSGIVSIYSTSTSNEYAGAFAAIKEDENHVRSVVTWGNKNYGGDFSYSDKYTAAAPEGSLSSGIVSIYSNYGAFAAIKEDENHIRSVITWGDKYSGGDFSYSDEYTAAAPEGSLSSGIVSIYSISNEYAGAFAALKEDENHIRSVVTWGNKDSGGDFTYSSASVAAAPEGSLDSGIVSIYSTVSAFAAIKEDENHVRSVVTWGNKNYGGDFTYSDGSTAAAPVGSLASGIVSIYSTRYGAFAAIKEDENHVRSVVTWGKKNCGGDFSYSDEYTAAAPEGSLSSGIVSIYSNNYAFAAIKEDENHIRSVVTWGDKDSGGDFTYSDGSTAAAPVGSLASGIVSIYSTRYGAFAAIKEDENHVRSVVTWGKKNYGGDFTYSDANVAAAPEGSLASGIISISSTEQAFAAIKEDENHIRSVITWGYKYYGALNSLSYGLIKSSLVNVSDIYSNGHAFAAIKEDANHVRSVVTWGDISYGGDFTYSDGSTAAAPEGSLSSGIISIYSNNYAFAAIKEDENGVRSVITWGYKYYGGDFTYSDANVAAAPEGSLDSGIISIYSTSDGSVGAFAALKEDENGVRSVVTWGSKTNGGDSSNPIGGDLSSGVTDIYSTSSAFAARKSDGSIVTWGSKFCGGDFTFSNGAVAAPPEGSLSSGIVSIYSNRAAFAAIKEDENHVRSVVTWGFKNYGGDFTYSDANVAAAPEGSLDSGIISIYSTSDGSVGAFAALKEDENGVKSVVTWGNKNYGGDFTYSSASVTAAPVGSLSSGIVSISSTQRAFAAIKEGENGVKSVVTWGNSNYGTDTSKIISYTGSNTVSDIVEIYSSSSFFVGVRSDGTYIAWGSFL